MIKYFKIYIFLAIMILVSYSTSVGQGYNLSIYLDFYDDDFLDPFQEGEPWEEIDPELVKNNIVELVTSDFSTYGINVSKNSGNLKIKFGGTGGALLGLTMTGIESFINYYHGVYPSPWARVFSTSFSTLPEYQGENATVERISQGLANIAAHEAGHLLNLFHAYMYSAFNPTIPGALSTSNYQPKPHDELPGECKSDPIFYEHIMATGNYTTNEQIASINRYFSINNSQQVLDFLTSGGGNVSWDMVWGISDIDEDIPKHRYDLKSNVNISSGKTLIIASGGYIHNLNGYTMQGGYIEAHGRIIPIDAPSDFSVQNSSAGVYSDWNSVNYATGYKIYRKSNGAYSKIAQVTSISYSDNNVEQGIQYTYYVKAYDSILEDGYQDGFPSEEISVTTPGPLTGNISCDVYPSENDWVNFTANVTGGNGNGNYSCAWYRAPENDPDNWFFLKCEVEDDETIASGTFNASYGCAKRYIEPEEAEIPDNFNLFNNYPNPFNPETTIKYALPEASKVSIKVYDVAGREVVNLTEGNKNAGYHTVKWNASNLPSGVYLCKMKAGRFTDVIKMSLVK